MNDNRKKQRPQGRRLPRREHAGARQRQNGSVGNAHQKYERYVALAQEAMRNGDTVEAENCYQHAEHYFRVMREHAA